MMNYGVPYMGSKSRIAERIIDALPPGDVLVDLFAGGCAITHAALLSGKWGRIVANDLSTGPELFIRAVHGEYRGERRWIGRDDFTRLKESDPYVRYCWSFGYGGRSYLYSREKEPYKRAVHYAIVFDEWEPFFSLCPEVAGAAKDALDGLTDRKERRMAFGPAVVRRFKETGDMSLLDRNPLYKSFKWRIRRGRNSKNLENLERLESLQSLESLESLERLERLELTRLDYREVEIPAGAVVYADPPYKGTMGYGIEFDNEAFYGWVRTRPYPVWVSEYNMPDDFVPVKEMLSDSRMGANGGKKVLERLYVHRRWARGCMAAQGLLLVMTAIKSDNNDNNFINI